MGRRRETTAVMLRVTPRGLVPATGADAEFLARYRNGTVVEAELHAPKSESQHRLLRRVVAIVADNTDKYPSGDALMTALKLKCGLYESVALIGGGIHLTPRSLTELDGPALNDFFERCIEIIETEVIPGFDTSSLMRESRKKERVS